MSINLSTGEPTNKNAEIYLPGVATMMWAPSLNFKTCCFLFFMPPNSEATLRSVNSKRCVKKKRREKQSCQVNIMMRTLVGATLRIFWFRNKFVCTIHVSGQRLFRWRLLLFVTDVSWLDPKYAQSLATQTLPVNYMSQLIAIFFFCFSSTYRFTRTSLGDTDDVRAL